MSCAVAATTNPSTRPVEFRDVDPELLVIPTEVQVGAIRARLDEGGDVEAVFRRDILPAAAEAVRDDPAPLPKIIYEGRVGNDPERVRTVERLRDLSRIAALTWASRMTDDERYARAAVRWTLAWVTSIQPSGNDVNDNKLTAILLATHLLRSSMAEQERRLCLDWSRSLGQKAVAGMKGAHGNRKAKRVKLIAAAAVVTEDAELSRQAVDLFKQYVASELRADGTSADLELRDAMAYHVSGLRDILEAALILRSEGADLYADQSPGGASVKHSVDFVLPFAKGQRLHAEWVNSKVKLDRQRWAAGDNHYRPGQTWDPRSAIAVFELAACFDPSLKETLDAIQPDDRPVTWQQILLRAVDP